MNVVRLYVSWEGTNTAKGTFNTTYLEEVRKVVRKAAEYKIDILLDAHEDAVARRYCGEGFPDWAVQGSNDTFPLPLTVSLDFNETGFPTLDSCLRINFLHYNTAFDAQYAWQKLYENIDGVQDQFAEFWKVVASYFKDEPNVIGYEVINEPYIANIYADIKYKDPKNNDIDHLTPLYDKVNEKIREVDNNTIIFFEPTVHDENIGIYKAPGGETFNNRSVFSYHVYCMNVTAEGEPTNLTECHKQDDKAFYYQYQVAQDLGLASFLTEFGALSNSYRSSEEVEYITNMAETHFQSWAYWQYKYYEDITTDAQPGSTESFYFDNGTVQATKVKALARPYAYRICGEPVSTRFTAENGIFELSYKPGNCSGLNTEVYLGEELHYPNGFQVNLGNCNACTLRSIDNHDSYYEILVEQPPHKWYCHIDCLSKSEIRARLPRYHRVDNSSKK